LESDAGGALAEYELGLECAQKAVEASQWKRVDYIVFIADAFYANKKI
jgi:hypothetical protein